MKTFIIKTLTALATIALVAFSTPVAVFADSMASSNFALQSDSVNFGGNNSSSGSYAMQDTAGEIATGYSNSANTNMHAGFQQGTSTSSNNGGGNNGGNNNGGGAPSGGGVGSGGAGGQVTTPPTYSVNVYDFQATAGQTSILLDWITPDNAKIAGVIIVRSDKFYPTDLNDGDVIYTGTDQEVIDHDVVAGKIYYYTLFAKNEAGVYSSGAIASARIAIPGENNPKPTGPFDTVPQAENVNPIIAALTLADFDFIQDGRMIEHAGNEIVVDAKKDLTIRLDYKKVPEILKTIAISLGDPSDPSKTFTFLLRVNKDKTAYEATIGTLNKNGRYVISAIILDYGNQGLKRINGDLRALVLGSAGDIIYRASKSPALLGGMIGLLILAFGLIIWTVRRAKNARAVVSATSTLLLIMALLLSSVATAHAAINKEMNYQGKLTDTTGATVADGTYTMEFDLYTASSGGSPIWTETWSGGNKVQVTNGLFSVMLGHISSLAAIDFNQTLYLGVNINNDGEMSPRKKLGAVPAAFVADTLDGLDSTAFLQINNSGFGDGCLKSTSGVISSSACASGGGSAGTWATTTSQVASEFVNYSNNSSDIVAIGSSSTTTAKYWFDPNAQVASLTGSVSIGGLGTLGNLLATGSTTLQNFTARNATTTNATTTTLFATTASSTNLFATVAQFGGISTSKISNLTSNGFVKTVNGDGTLSVDTNSYLLASGVDFIKQNNYGNLALTASTTIPLWIKDRLFASSSAVIAGNVTASNFTATSTTSSTFPYASTTYVTASSGALLASSGGTVSIGTFNPASPYTLDVTGTSNFNGNLFFGNGRAFLGFGTGNNGQIANAQGADVEIYPDSSHGLIVKQSGNVGIGSTSPYAALSVVGDTGVVAQQYTATGTRASTFPYASTTALTASGFVYAGNLLATGSSTLQNFTGANATTTNATSTTSFASVASSTNLFATAATLGLINGQQISSSAIFTGTVTATGGLTTLANLLLSGSTTLQNFTALNSTTTNATTTTLFATTGASTNFSSTNLTTTNLTLNTLNGPLQANNGVVSATTSIGVLYGGTGQTSYTTGDLLYASSATALSRLGVGGNGTCLTSNGTIPLWGSCTSGSGGGSSTWSTTTSQVAGQNINYSSNSSDIVVVGGTSTSSAKYYFDPNAQTASLTGSVSISGQGTLGNILATGSSTLQNFTGRNATTTNATSTTSFASVASSTNLFATAATLGLINGQQISSSAIFTGTVTATGGLTTLANLLLSGSTTLQNFTALNSTTTNATSTTLYAASGTFGNNVLATLFTATSSTATSTFAGILSVGSTTPYSTALFNVGTSSPLLSIDKVSGLVGIGTAPINGSQLTVQNRSGSTHVFTVKDSTNTSVFDIAENGVLAAQSLSFQTNTISAISGATLNSSNNSNAVTLTVDGNASQSADVLRFSTLGARRLTMDKNGLIGIGTSSPLSILSVNATSSLSNIPLFSVVAVPSLGATTTAFSVSTTGNVLFPYASSTALTASGFVYAGNLLATGSSTLQNFTGANATTTNATSTTSFASVASSTNLFATAATLGLINGQQISSSAIFTGTLTATGGLVTILNELHTGSTTLQAFTATNATTTNATTTTLFATTASSTNLFATNFTVASLTSGQINGQTISSAANFTGTLTATGGLTTLSNLLLTGSTTFQSFTATNATSTNATSTNLFATTAQFGTVCLTGDTCRTTWPTGGGTPDWNKQTNYGVLSLTPTTTLPVWLKDQLFASSSAIFAGSVTGNNFIATSTGTTAFTISNGNFAVNGTSGNVTVGVNAILAATGLYNGSVSNAGFAFTNGVDALQFRTSAQGEVARFLSNGNFGIGTTSPYAALSVVGATGIVADKIFASSTTATSTFAGGLNVGSGALTYDFTSGRTSVDNISVGSFSFDTDAGVVSWADMPVDSNAPVGTAESYIASINSNPLLTLYSESNGTGGVRSLGVSVGSTSPYAKLSVWGNGTGTGQTFAVINSASTTQFAVRDNGSSGFGTTSPFATLAINPVAGAASNQFVIGSSTATSFIVNNTGWVGIGTTSPWGQLSINANALTGPEFVIGSSTKTDFIVTNGGRVALGTTSPAWNFQIYGTRPFFTLSDSSAGTNLKHWTQSSQGGNFYLATSSDVLATSSVAALTVTSQGWVGIGSTSPSANLGVVGTVEANSFYADSPNATSTLNGNLSIGSNAVADAVMQFGTDPFAWALGNLSSDSTFRIASSTMIGSGDILTINKTGNTGLGTTSPWRTLSVTGSLAINGLTAAAGTSDAVCINSVTKEILVNTGAATCTVSSEKYKHDIQALDSGLDEIMALKPSQFRLNVDNSLHLGFIAEEVLKVDPRLVVLEQGSTSPRTVRYEEITAILAKAIQEQQAQIGALQKAASSSQVFDPNMIANQLATSTTFIQQIATAVKDAIQSAGDWVVARISAASLTVGTKDKPNGVTIFDKANGDPYCLNLVNGALIPSKGSCESQAPLEFPTPVPTIADLPNQPNPYVATSTNATSTTPVATTTPVTITSTSTPETGTTTPVTATSTPVTTTPVATTTPIVVIPTPTPDPAPTDTTASTTTP